MKFKKIINEILCLAMAITMFSSGVVKVQANDTPKNLTQLEGVSATASSVEANTSFTADLAIDGDKSVTSRWAANSGTNQWLLVDLGTQQTFNTFVIYNNDKDGEDQLIKEFIIE